MANFSVLPNSGLINKIASDFSDAYITDTKIGSMERKAQILDRFTNNKPLTMDEIKEAEIPLVHHGFNVYEDSKGRTWWLEDGQIYRPDDESIHAAVEQYLRAQKISK